MWQPDPAWRELRSGAGQCTVGVWRAEHRSGPAVVKRLRRPGPQEGLLHEPGHPAYWRREAEVALAPEQVTAPGLRTPTYLRVDEDAEGVTIWAAELSGEPPTGLYVARSLGRFAGAEPPAVPWASRDLLRSRLDLTADRGGWPTLARTTLADAAAHLWERRGHWLQRHLAGETGRIHADACPGNFPVTEDGDVVAVDWQGFGTGPIGLDVGSYALTAREDFDVLLAAFCEGVRSVRPDIDPEQVAVSARVVNVYTVLSRAEWALARAAHGEGALAGKFRHPSIAPHLRAVQRAFPQIEWLLEST